MAIATVAATWAAGGSARADTNIALGKTVSEVAIDPYANPSFNNNTAGNLQNITNGTILPDPTTSYWSPAAAAQAIEWNGAGTVFEIALGGAYTITSLIVDADDNDAYQLQVYNSTTSSWDALYTVPIVSTGYGIRARDYTLPTSVTTDAVRIFGGVSNDNYTFGGVGGQGGYGVAQVELFGAPAVPEPASTTLLGAGLIGLIRRRRRRKV